VENLEDLFSTPADADDQTLSTEGVEELFAAKPAASSEDGLLFVDGSDGEAASEPSRGPIHDLLTALAEELRKLADDIHRLLAD